jgi:hypothetical protein
MIGQLEPSPFFVNGQAIIPVIIAASGRSKIKAIIVGHEVKGSYFTLNAKVYFDYSILFLKRKNTKLNS